MVMQSHPEQIISQLKEATVAQRGDRGDGSPPPLGQPVTGLHSTAGIVATSRSGLCRKRLTHPNEGRSLPRHPTPLSLGIGIIVPQPEWPGPGAEVWRNPHSTDPARRGYTPTDGTRNGSIPLGWAVSATFPEPLSPYRAPAARTFPIEASSLEEVAGSDGLRVPVERQAETFAPEWFTKRVAEGIRDVARPKGARVFSSVSADVLQSSPNRVMGGRAFTWAAAGPTHRESGPECQVRRCPLNGAPYNPIATRSFHRGRGLLLCRRCCISVSASRCAMLAMGSCLMSPRNRACSSGECPVKDFRLRRCRRSSSLTSASPSSWPTPRHPATPTQARSLAFLVDARSRSELVHTAFAVCPERPGVGARCGRCDPPLP
jgi:hypothetical protein